MRDLALHQPKESLQSVKHTLHRETWSDLLSQLLGKVNDEVSAEAGPSTNAKA